MARKSNKQKRIARRLEEQRAAEQKDKDFRDELLKSYEPIIPFSQPIRTYEYRCVSEGSIGHPDHCSFVQDEIYKVRKYRFSLDRLEVSGRIRNTRTGHVFHHKSFMCLPIENCKASLKIIKTNV